MAAYTALRCSSVSRHNIHRLYYQRLPTGEAATAVDLDTCDQAAVGLRLKILREECPPDVRRAALTVVLFPGSRTLAADEEDIGGERRDSELDCRCEFFPIQGGAVRIIMGSVGSNQKPSRLISQPL